MSNANEVHEAAFDELRKAGVKYRIKECKCHDQIYIEGSPMIITISCPKKDRDNRVSMNVRRDIRRSIAMIGGSK